MMDTFGIDLAVVTRISRPHDHDGRRIESGQVAGWIALPQPIGHLEIIVDGRLITVARVELPRPDVATRFPSLAHAGHAGFVALLDGGLLPDQGDSLPLTLRAHLADGEVVTLNHELTVMAPGALAAAEPVRMNVDRCEVDPLGMIWVSGWAVATAPILAIQVMDQDVQIATTNVGLMRPDVLAAFPDYHAPETSGFQVMTRLPAQVAATLQTVRVEAIARNGAFRSATVPVQRRASAMPVIAEARPVPAFAAAPAWTKPVEVEPPAGDNEPTVHFHCDVPYLCTDGTVQVVGWALAPAGIKAINGYLDGELVGSARLGFARPDVGQAYPHIAGSGNAGFSLNASLEQSFEGEHALRLEIELNDDATRSFELSLTAMEPAATPQADDSSHASVMLAVDGMQIEGGHSRRPLTGAFHLVGWAVARQGIASVEVFLDDQPIGRAYHGIRREDVGNAFPNFHNPLLGGYALSVPSRLLKNGRSLFRVLATDIDGAMAEVIFTADIDKSGSDSGPQALRRKMPHAETSTAMAILAARGAMPVHDIALRLRAGRQTAERALRTLESLVRQPYPHWRLWLAPADKRVDPRALQKALIKQIPEAAAHLHLLEQYKPAKAGQLASVLNAGDEVAVHALLTYSLHATGEGSGDLIYGDDRRQDHGGDVTAFFKPDWSPDLMLSQNYLGRSWVASAELLRSTGLSLPELAARSDYANALRLSEQARNIRHVQSVTLQAFGKAAAPNTERQALQDAMKRRGIEARVEAGPAPFLHRVHRRPRKPGKVSIIMPSIGARAHIRTCLESMRKLTRDIEYEVVIVDNLREATLTEEQRGWKEWFLEHGDVVVPVDEPFNWSRLNNLGAAAASGDYLLFLNDDIEVLDPDWLSVLMAEAERPEVGLVGAHLLYPDGKVQHAGMFMSRTELGNGRHAFRFAAADDPGYFGLALSQRNVLCVTGACMMMRREVFEAVDGFDEAHSVVNNDVDFCLRVHRSGRLIVFTPHTRLTHHELASRANLKDEYDKTGFLEVWGDLCQAGDPFHNPNISSEADDYAFEEEPLREVYAGHPLADKAQIKRILIVKLDHIGDLVTGLPAFRRIRQHFPNAEITALVGRSAISIAQTEAALDHIIPFEFFDARSGLGQKKLTDADYAALGAMLQEKRFDLAIDLRKLGDTRHILQYSGATWLAGYDHNQNYPWLDIALEWERDALQTNKRNHVADDLLNLADAVGNAFLADRRTIVPVGALSELSEGLREEFAELFSHDYVVVHPASGTPLRQWAPEYFAKLIDMLIERSGVRVALIGGPDEQEIAQKVIAAVKNQHWLHNLVGKSRLNEVPRILAESVLFVGNNSGPSHVASGLGVPTISVHSAVIASEEWGPLGPDATAIRRDMSCAPCYIVSAAQCHRSMACLHSISPQSIYEVCERYLALRSKKIPKKTNRK